MPQDAAGATYSRDALAKAIYSRLFDYIVQRVNQVLGFIDDPSYIMIGILDIYGFEIFEVSLKHDINILRPVVLTWLS